jgi:ELWxxDGT repeat protein
VFPGYLVARRYLWRTDDTMNRTTRVKSINAGGPQCPYWLTPVDHSLYFLAHAPDHRRGLWKTTKRGHHRR